MQKAQFLSVDLIENHSLDNNVFSEIASELQTGVSANSVLDEKKLTEFKVEQKISSLDASANFNFGGFVNSNSKIKSLKTSYRASLLSNNYNVVTGSGNTKIVRRYGIGFELTLDVKDVETKINANYGIVAASGALKLAKCMYKITVYGVVSAQLAQYLPAQEGVFTNDIFKKIQAFFVEAKKHLGTMDKSKVYPIEVINNMQIVPDKANTRSIYFAANFVAGSKNLSECILFNQQKKFNFDENIIQFIYSYFGLKDAYGNPSPIQAQTAKDWIDGNYNKIESTPTGGSWVEVDSSYIHTLADNSEYKPHAIPLDWATAGKVLEDESFEISANYSSEIKVAAMVNTSAEFNTYTLGRRIVHYMDISDNITLGSKVLETRYGIGIRVIIKISGVEFGTDVSLSGVGAIAELNLGNVEYEISGIGISDNDLITLLPVPQNINQDTFSEINDTIQSLKDKIAAMDATKFEPQALRIRIEEPENADPTLNAQAEVLAYRFIKEKEKLNDTLIKAKQLGLPEESIKVVYAKLGINGNDDPRREDKLEAIKWLEFDE